MVWAGVTYYGKCNYYVLIVLDIVLGESLFKITLEFLVFH